jgi:hypothetical protein
MPVSLPITDPKKLCMYLGFPDGDELDEFVTLYQLRLNSEALYIFDKEDMSDNVGQVSLPSLVFATRLQKMTLSPHDRSAARMAFKQIIKQIVSVSDESSPLGSLLSGGDKIFPIDQMHSAPLVKLRDATMLYQPVNGSGATSRYFAVAISEGLKIAARYTTPNSLSMRVEGDNLHTHKDALLMAGFDAKGNDYMSIHLTGVDKFTAQKAIGAILLALNMVWETPIPQPSVITG